MLTDEEKLKRAVQAKHFVVLGYFVDEVEKKEGSGLRLPVYPVGTPFSPGSWGEMLARGDVEALRGRLAETTSPIGERLLARDPQKILDEWRELGTKASGERR